MVIQIIPFNKKEDRRDMLSLAAEDLTINCKMQKTKGYKIEPETEEFIESVEAGTATPEDVDRFFTGLKEWLYPGPSQDILDNVVSMIREIFSEIKIGEGEAFDYCINHNEPESILPNYEYITLKRMLFGSGIRKDRIEKVCKKIIKELDKANVPDIHTLFPMITITCLDLEMYLRVY